MGERAEKIIACIGINPSTAAPNNLDNTLKSVKRIAAYNGFEGWLMLIVYPQRATNPSDLDIEMNNHLRFTNTQRIVQSIQAFKIDTIWVAYGDLIDSRNYLSYCMADLFTQLCKLPLKWQIIGTPTQKGHPRHPLYKATKSKLVDFDMANYAAIKLLPHLNPRDIV